MSEQPLRRGRPSYMVEHLAGRRASPAPDNTMAVHCDLLKQGLRAARQILEELEQLAGNAGEYHRTAPATRPAALDDPRWATVEKAAEHCCVTAPTVRSWLREAGSAVRTNQHLRHLRLSIADLDRWLAEAEE